MSLPGTHGEEELELLVHGVGEAVLLLAGGEGVGQDTALVFDGEAADAQGGDAVHVFHGRIQVHEVDIVTGLDKVDDGAVGEGEADGGVHGDVVGVFGAQDEGQVHVFLVGALIVKVGEEDVIVEVGAAGHDRVGSGDKMIILCYNIHITSIHWRGYYVS